MPKYMTTEELAELLRRSPHTIRYWRQVGEGPRSFRAGKGILYDYDEVLEWIEEQKALAEAGE